MVYSHFLFRAETLNLTTTPRSVRFGGRVLWLALPTPPFPALTWTGGATSGWGVAIDEGARVWLCDCHPSALALTRTQAKETLAALQGKASTLAEVVPDSEGWAWVRVAGQTLLLPVSPLVNILTYGITHRLGGQ